MAGGRGSRWRDCGQLARPEEDGVEHFGFEHAGERVLLGGVVGAEEGRAGGDPVLGAVAKFWLGPDVVEAQRGVPGEGAEADDHLDGEQGELAGGIG